MDKKANRFYNIVKNLIYGDMDETYGLEVIRKVMLLNVISITGVVFVIPLGVIAFIQGNSYLGTFDFVNASVLIANMVYLRKTHTYKFSVTFGVIFTGIFYLFLLINGGVHNSAVVWYYTFPLMSAFLLGSKKGAIASVLMLIFAIIFFTTDPNTPWVSHYSRDFIIRFIPSYIVILIFSWAFEYFREKTQAELTSKNAELNKAIAELQKTGTMLRKTQDGLEKRVQERTEELSKINTQLTNEAEERIRIQNNLTASLNEKEILLKEIYHRVKNNLQVISSLLSLQAKQINDPKVVIALRDSQSRVHSMSLVHEQLYQTSDLGHIDLRQYLQNLSNHLYRLYKNDTGNTSLVVQSDDINLAIDDAIPCGLIVTELVSNSLKYAFPNQLDGEIAIEAHHIENIITLKISDDGIGLPPKTDIEKITSLGLELVQSLTQQLNGTLEVEPEIATFTLSFPSNI